MATINPPLEKIFRQIAAYPHYDILRHIKNIPEDIDDSILFKFACYFDKNYKNLITENKKIQYIDFVKNYHTYSSDKSLVSNFSN